MLRLSVRSALWLGCKSSVTSCMFSSRSSSSHFSPDLHVPAYVQPRAQLRTCEWSLYRLVESPLRNSLLSRILLCKFWPLWHLQVQSLPLSSLRPLCPFGLSFLCCDPKSALRQKAKWIWGSQGDAPCPALQGLHFCVTYCLEPENCFLIHLVQFNGCLWWEGKVQYQLLCYGSKQKSGLRFWWSKFWQALMPLGQPMNW